MTSKLQKSKFNKAVEAAIEENEKESWLHNGLTPGAYACLITFGSADQKQWLSDAAIMKAEQDHEFGKDPKVTAQAFHNMKNWLMQNKVGRAGGNKRNILELAETEKQANEIYFGKAKAKIQAKASAEVKPAVAEQSKV